MPNIHSDLTDACVATQVGTFLSRMFYGHHRFDLKNRISQFAIHLRELAIRKNLKTNKIAIQKKLWGKAKLRIKSLLT